jgi:hypothetical protein
MAETLPLTIRKGLRDAEPKIKAAIEAIEKEFGITGVTFEADYLGLWKELDEKQKANVVHVPYYLERWLPSAKSTILKDALAKKAIINTWTTKKIVFRFNPKTEGYLQAVFEGGVLFFQTKTSSFWCNIDDLGKKVPVGASTGSEYPLALEQDFAKYESKLKENLARIDKALGVTGMTLQIVDWKKCEETAGGSYKNRLGEVSGSWYLGGLAGNLERLCKDEMVKEAIRDAIPKKVITLRVDAAAKSYHEEKFEDGCLAILIKPGSYASNVDSTGKELDKLL